MAQKEGLSVKWFFRKFAIIFALFLAGKVEVDDERGCCKRDSEEDQWTGV